MEGVNMERYLGKYEADKKGLFKQTDEGKFRPIDIRNGKVVTTRPMDYMNRRFMLRNPRSGK
jgi:hypothetical protein